MAAPAGSLIFEEETIRKKSYSIPLRIRTDANRECVLIEIGEQRPTRAVALSNMCVALVSKDELTGLRVIGL
jgi:hypothetical protein